jgi:hypothetical protein
VAEKLYDKNANYAGYVSRGDGIQAVYTLAPFVFGMGGRWIDENGRPDMTSEAFMALDLYSGLTEFDPGCGATWRRTSVRSGNAAMNTDFPTSFLL